MVLNFLLYTKKKQKDSYIFVCLYWAKKKEENNKKAKGGLSSESKLFESIPYNGTNNVVVMEHLVGGNENVGTLTARVSLEELAKNRGDAMLQLSEWDDKEEGKEVTQQWEDDWDDDDVSDDFSLQLRRELESNTEKN